MQAGKAQSRTRQRHAEPVVCKGTSQVWCFALLLNERDDLWNVTRVDAASVMAVQCDERVQHWVYGPQKPVHALVGTYTRRRKTAMTSPGRRGRGFESSPRRARDAAAWMILIWAISCW